MGEMIENLLVKNGLVFAFVVVGIIMLLGQFISKKFTKGKIPAVAISILMGLGLAFFGDKKGLSNIPIFSGMALLGGSMLRDFAVVATAMGVDVRKIKQAGLAGVIALFAGVLLSFLLGAVAAFALGYRDAESITTIGAGACTYIVGPVTGTALNASSSVIAISVAAGVVKSIATTIFTPMIAARIGLDNSKSAMVFGGLIGTTSGVTAGLAATDAKLVPYGALTATFYTGLGCLLCPSILYLIVRIFI